MNHTTIYRYEVDDRILADVEPGLTWSGVVIDKRDRPGFCGTCHCGVGAADHDDGTLCCPGPWYGVILHDPSGPDPSEPPPHTMSYAEHELQPYPGSPCPGCGQPRRETWDDEFGRNSICQNEGCVYDK